MRMEHSENFKAVLEEKTREAESIIAAYLPKEEGFAKELAKAIYGSHGDDSHPFPDPR